MVNTVWINADLVRELIDYFHNCREMTTGATYPHINFSVPASLLWPVVKDYIQSRGDCQNICLSYSNAHIVFFFGGFDTPWNNVQLCGMINNCIKCFFSCKTINEWNKLSTDHVYAM